ncbi:MAG: nucleotide exchange factor GrpE, partial [Candidatus Pacearchaeota archaeon]|nr:nucleotide exchange factor GrpE [Candidatus Pacearchaeota archaeon]
GVAQIAEQARSFLKSHGVREVKAKGQHFDPELHEAVGMVAGGESGVVAEEVGKGYAFGDRLLRAAKVRVYK